MSKKTKSKAPWGYKKGTKIPRKRPGRKTIAELARKKATKKRK